jgi:hypothetical protein
MKNTIKRINKAFANYIRLGRQWAGLLGQTRSCTMWRLYNTFTTRHLTHLAKQQLKAACGAT